MNSEVIALWVESFSSSLSSSCPHLLPVSLAISFVSTTLLLIVTWESICDFVKMAWRHLQVLQMAMKTPIIDETRHGGELIASVFKAHGVQSLFTLSGGHISPVLVASEKLGIKVIDTRHEVNAVFAADAVARVSGVPGVAVVTAGPGLTNTVTAIKNAQMAESPLVLLGGCPATLLKGRGALQDIDHMSVFKSITKWQRTVNRVKDIVPTVREAFKQAQSGTPGPVFIELPLDILYQYPFIKKEIMGKTKAGVMAWYLENYARSVFHEGFVEQDVSPLKIDIPTPTSDQVKRAADLVMKSSRPLILLGSQSVLPPVGGEGLANLINQIRLPVYLGGMSRGLLGPSSQLQMRQKRKDAMKESDLIVMGGMVADFRLGYGASLPTKVPIIAINRDKDQLYKNHNIFWKAALPIQADVGSFFKMLQTELKDRNYVPKEDWIKTLRDRDNAVEDKNKDMGKEETDKHLNPVHVLQTLDSVLPENTYLVADGGDFVATSSYIMHPRGPLKWLDPGAYGTLGCGGGFALGVKAAKPDANVVIIYGDGSVGYTIMEFDTMARHNLPVTAVVGNDACWTQIVREQVTMLGAPTACMLEYTDYHKTAESLGGIGIKLDRSNQETMKETFAKAIEMTRTTKKPVLVNVLIGKTKFREGSISV